MKLFTNKFFYLCVSLVFLAACGKETSATNEVTEPEVIVVEEETPVLEKTEQPANEPTAAPVATPSTSSATTASQPRSLYPGEVVTSLKNWDKKLSFLTTNFKQTSSYDGVQISRSQGTLKYDKKRDLLRLDTLNNEGALEQTALTDKKNIIIFDETGRQVTKLSWKEWQQGQPNQALFDFGNYTALLNRHNATLEKADNGAPVLVLTPKEGEQYTLYLTLSQTDYFPTSIKIVSDLMVTQSDLSHTDKSTPLDISTFGGILNDDAR